MVFWKKSQQGAVDADGSSTHDDGAKRVQFSSKVKGQLWILALCRFAEPVALTSVFPYLYFMIESFNVPKKDIAFWVGITSASFAISQFFSGVIWGRLSDRYGRKYTILAGLTGTLLSCLLFGFSKSLPVAIFARCVAGLLNGNVGIMRTFVAEIVPEKELQPFAFSLMPFVWSAGSVIGPMIGGFLSDPVRNHPDHFASGGFLSKYPFCLPNLFNCAIFTFSIIIGYLFLEESLATIKHERDSGVELGKKVKGLFVRGDQKQKNMRGYVADESDDETSLLLPPADEEDRTDQPFKPVERPAPPSIKEAFTVQSTLNIVVYAFLALQGVAFDQLLPVYMSYPGKTFDAHNPLKFFGGFGMPSTEVGAIFSVFGFIAMATQFLVYPPIARALGPLLTLKACFIIYPTVYFLVPFAIYLPDEYQKPALYVLLFLKQTAGVFSFPNMIMMLTNSASSLRVLGTLNGVATTAASLGRAIGPSIGGAAFSYGQRIQYLILPWWMIAAIAILGALPVVFLVEGKGWAANEDDASKSASQATTANGSSSSSVVEGESETEGRVDRRK